MSTLTVTIAGADLTSQYQTGSLSITEQINNKSNSATLRMAASSSGTVPQPGAAISISDSARTPMLLFAGFVSRVRTVEYGVGSFFTYELEATDYTYILLNRVAARDYTNQTLAYIVADLIGGWADDQSFDLTNVATGPTIASVAFNYVSLRSCFEQLAKLTGYVWWVGYDKKIYFQTPTTTAAPDTFKDSAPSNHESVTIHYDTSQVRNSITVHGSSDGEASANTVVQSFTANGTQTSWELDNKPDSIVSITVDGVAQQFSLDVNQQDTDEFVYSFSGASISIAASGTTPTNGQIVAVTYYPRIPIIANVQDAPSIAFFKAYEGGTGIHDGVISDTSVKTKAQARERGLQELEEFAMPLVTGKVLTRSDMLAANTIFRPGQALTVNLPSWGISTDTAYLIQQVRTWLNEDGSSIIYTYEITFGGKPVGVQEFLETLVPRGGVSRETIEVLHAAGVETATASDSAPDMDTFTPPFQYGPGGSPQGKWGLSEWS